MAIYPKRLIEADLPIKRISAHARREKSIRHGHISTLHIWWARRPLAACRAVTCATLWPDPVDPNCPSKFLKAAKEHMLAWSDHFHLVLLSEESRPRFERARRNPSHFEDLMELRHALLDFIADFANWDNSTIREYLETSRALTQLAHEALGGAPHTRPLVADPFAGGGSIPLEALRVGADAFASDLNPIPVLLNKVVLELVPRFGQELADEVRSCGAWIKKQAQTELLQFFPNDKSGAVPSAFFWARTIVSEAPAQGPHAIEVPLLRSMWLAKKGKRKFALRWVRDSSGGVITRKCKVMRADGVERIVLRPQLEVFAPKTESDVEHGTSRAGAATCPVTGFTTPVEAVRIQLAERHGGANDARLIAVATLTLGESGRAYRNPEEVDYEAYTAACRQFLQRSNRRVSLPTGKLSHLRGFFNIVLYGMETWGDLFSARQALAVTTFGGLVTDIADKKYSNSDLGIAVQTCLALAVDRLAEKLTSVARWDVTRENPQGTFGRQALPMVWDFCEVNPFSGAGGDWETALDWVVRVLEANASISLPADIRGNAVQASATKHPLPNDSVSAVFTDPPYYAAVPYADLSDFFYSWLKQTIGSSYPTLFRSELSPKPEELVSLAHRAAMYREKTGAWFETGMAQACGEARRICSPAGLGVIVFANKETAGWEAMLSALVSSGWTITASWPIDTEMGSRLRAQNSAALASSVHLVCRPREEQDGSVRRDDTGDWRDVLQELPVKMREWMPRLAQEGVVGADAIFACLGPALEIYSRYSRVEKASGEQVTLREYLEHVWAAVSREALSSLIAGTDLSALEADARITAMWLWTLNAGSQASAEPNSTDDEGGEEEDGSMKASGKGGYSLEYDAARKIAQGLGASLEDMKSVIEVRGDQARLLPVNERTAYLFGKDQAAAPGAPARGKKKVNQMDLFAELTGEASTAEAVWEEKIVNKRGATVLDRVHQAMILFATGRGEALKRFLVDDGVGSEPALWKLAQALSALYPPGSQEKRWVDGVLARKKGLGL